MVVIDSSTESKYTGFSPLDNATGGFPKGWAWLAGGSTRQIVRKKTVRKYNFSRAKWYNGNYNSNNRQKLIGWCNDHFGKQDIQPNAWSRWTIDRHYFFLDANDCISFRDEADLIVFKLGCPWSV